MPYARRVSGVQIRGDAHTWWDQAAGVYARGPAPAPGAILTLARTPRLKSGHLAVVQNLLGPRDITVTHANWGDDMASRRIVYESMRVQDASPANDWTQVRFWNREAGQFGFPYPVQGFIYPVREQPGAYVPQMVRQTAAPQPLTPPPQRQPARIQMLPIL